MQDTSLHLMSVSRPGEPTDAVPGSEEKIRIMIERASRREALFHPQDNTSLHWPPSRMSQERDIDQAEPALSLIDGPVDFGLNTQDWAPVRQNEGNGEVISAECAAQTSG